MNKYEIASELTDEFFALLDEKYANEKFSYACMVGHLKNTMYWASIDNTDRIKVEIERMKSDKVAA